MGFQKIVSLKNYSTHLKSLLLLVIALIVKVTPHLPNLSPELVFTIYLTTRWNKLFALSYAFLMWVLCDVAYAVIYHTQAFGSWTLSTYSAVFFIILFSSFNKNKLNGYWLIGYSCVVSLLFWIWTNAGVWIFSNMYPHSPLGLAACYEMALPFLAYAFTSAVFWSVVLLIARYWFYATASENELSTQVA